LTDTTSPADRATAYLEGLYGKTPQGLLWIGGHADGWRGRTFHEPRAAGEYAVTLDRQGGIGVYHRSTTLKHVPDRRGEASDSQAVYYFALDADISGPGHKADNLPGAREDIDHLIELAGFPQPTLWVASGGGFYPQWHLHEPLDVRGSEDLTWVTETFTALSAHFIEVAAGQGWKLDNVRDLARVFRLPGTTNRKVPGQDAPCEVAGQEGERHDLGALAGIVRRVRRPADPQPVDSSVDDGLTFDTPGRTFTRTQATDFIKAARRRLEAAEPGGYNVAINDFAMACSHFPWLIDQERVGREVIRALGSKEGWTEPDAKDRATIASAYRAGSWVAQEVPEGPDQEDGQKVPDVLPPPTDPLAVVRVLTAGRADLTWWRDDFYQHQGTYWAKWELAEVKRWLYDLTGDAIWFKPGKEGPEPVRWAPTRKRIGDLIEALGEGSLSRFGQEEKCMALANGVLDPETRALAEHTPARFNLSALPFTYDPAARAPEWEKFLESSLPNDREAHEFLAEWFGYVLSGRTDLQKICALVGPRRCGKGTTGRVLRAMVGQEGWCAPTLAKLSSEGFGQESMIGKSLAIMGDVRWTSKHVVDAVPTLLGISGEDGIDIERKYQKVWSGKLGTRIMLMSNDSPAFTDASGALAGRMVYAAFEHSFYGREDLELEGRLMAELPGILNWALDGLDRLNRNGGRFTQSSRSMVLRDEVDRDSSPVAAWVEDRCELDPTAEFYLESLFRSYRDWLTAENAAYSPTLARFSRDLQSAFRDQGLTVVRKTVRDSGKHRIVTGIRPIVGGSIPPTDEPFD
jgi:putative DNA primase/helicase